MRERGNEHMVVWCITCQRADCPDVKPFKTAFHHVNGVLVSAGVCNRVKRPEMAIGSAVDSDVQTQAEAKKAANAAAV